jgi:hypothetical protein
MRTGDEDWMELTQKDLLELRYWVTADMDHHKQKLSKYLEAFEVDPAAPLESVLDIGSGPLYGFLSLLEAEVKVGVDPLFEAYYQMAIADPNPGYTLFNERFENWGTGRKFQAVFCVDALDHGDMDPVIMLQRLAYFTQPGGRLYLHVHLRPRNMLNLIHDHQVKEEHITEGISKTQLQPVLYKKYEKDIDGAFCEAIVGVWQQP